RPDPLSLEHPGVDDHLFAGHRAGRDHVAAKVEDRVEIAFARRRSRLHERAAIGRIRAEQYRVAIDHVIAVALEKDELRSKKKRRPGVVCVEERDDLAAGMLDGGVAGDAGPAVSLRNVYNVLAAKVHRPLELNGV